MRSVGEYTKTHRQHGTTKWAFAVLFFVSASGAGAQNLDLRALAKFQYQGQDDARQKAPCNLLPSTVSSDFGGRLYQDYVVWTAGPAGASYKSRYTGRVWDLAPDLKLDNGRVQYNVSLPPNFLLVIVSSVANPLQIQEFTLSETDPVTGRPAPRILCRRVVSSSR